MDSSAIVSASHASYGITLFTCWETHRLRLWSREDWLPSALMQPVESWHSLRSTVISEIR